MKSIEMTEETYAGIPADVEAFTLDDEKRWFDSQDISCMPAVLATLKGLRATATVTAITVQNENGEDLATLTLAVGEKAKVKVSRTPAYANTAATWESATPATVKVTAIDESYAEIERLASGTIVVTATCNEKTDTVSVQ